MAAMGSTVAELLERSVKRLAAAGLTSPREDAELLLATVLGRTRAFLLAHPEFPVTVAAMRRFSRWIERRSDSYPIQYLRGRQEFFGREFFVDERVLIPRPETELVVEVVLDLLKGTSRPRVLEIGAGSGCIAVTLACERPEARIVATDVSPAALAVARHNADRHGVRPRVSFVEGRTVQPVEAGQRFDLIVSNPPYVALGDPRVTPEVARWEPRAALFAGETGLEIHREILAEAAPLLRAGGRLVLEIGESQRAGVVRAAREQGWALAALFRDLARIERCLVFSRT
jgi:release factor glutamine methyltransferase